MVKPDVRRDYYAELNTLPGAEQDEIKKQFRKLALKFHPDRNPGREIELTPKFQAIQEAHEVLTDPYRRLKYDTDRLRAGYGRTSAPRKATAASQPRKPPFPTASAKTPFPRPSPGPHNWSGPAPSNPYGQAPPSAGAQKYTSYTKAGAASWDKRYDEAKTRADAFAGFQEMKNGRPSSAGWSGFDPRTGRPGPANPGASRPRETKPPSAYETYHTRSTGPSTKKKNGFAPGTPGGDEPMAKNTSAYVNSASRNERFSSYFETTAAPTAKKQPEEFSSMPNLQRTSSRYASVGGEKTYIPSRLGKSTETRNQSSDETDSRSRTNPPSPKSPRSQRNTKHRSASPQPRPTRNQPVSPSSTSSSDTEDEVLPNIRSRPKAVPRSRKARNPQSTNSPSYIEVNYGWRPGPTSWSPKQPKARKYTPEEWDWSANFEGADAWNGNAAQPRFNGAADSHFTGQAYGTAHHQAGQYSDGGLNPKFHTSNGSNKGSLNNKPKSKSDENFGANFSFEWDKNFDNAAFHFNATPESGPRMAAAAGPQSGRAQEAQRKPSEPAGADRQAFSPEKWSDLMQSPFWIPEKDKREAPEHQRQRSPKKQPKTAPKRAAVPKTATVSTEADEAEATLGPQNNSVGSQQTSNGGAEIMDIDFDIPVSNSKSTPKASVPKAEAPATPTPKAEEAPEPSLFNFKTFESVAPFTPTNDSGINDLKDLKTTLPFDSQPAENARPKVRARDLNLPKPPKLPATPEFSTVPSLPGSIVLKRTSWDQYISAMEAYMCEWNKFNNKMIGHFNARQNLVETALSPNWMKAAGDTTRLNLNADGDTPEKHKRNKSSIDDDASDGEQLVFGQPKGGYSAYLRGVEEDFVVREHWSVAWERHRKCIYTLGQVRDWIRSGGKMI